MTTRTVHLTVAICTWNRSGLLRQTLDQLTRVTVPPGTTWELLVVNNNCTDGTDAVIGAFADRLPIRRLFERTPGLSHARNRALTEANGDYILWIDDDVLVSQDWLVAFVDSAIRFPAAAAFGGPIEPWFPVPPDPVLLAAFPWLRRGFCGIDYGSEQCVLSEDRPIYGANMAFARGAIAGLRFDGTLGTVQGSGMSGEETDFVARLCQRGGSVVWCPAMRVRHYVDPSRMKLEYLKRYTLDLGRSLVRLNGVGCERTWLGAPPWLWRQMAEAYGRGVWNGIARGRRERLMALKDRCRLRGMIQEYRLMQSERSRKERLGRCM